MSAAADLINFLVETDLEFLLSGLKGLENITDLSKFIESTT